MELTTLMNAVVSATARVPTTKGFGTPKIIGYHTNTQETVKSYSGTTLLSDLIADGFTANDPIYRTANSIVGQTNKPKTVLVGKLATTFTHIFTLTVADNVVEDKVYSFNLISPAGVSTSISYTALVTDTDASVATALAALITAVTGIGATALASVITCTADNTGEMWLCNSLDPNDLQYLDTTADTNLATELASQEFIDSSWYALYLADPPSTARNKACADYVETLEKIFGGVTHDYTNIDSTSTDDWMYNAKAQSYLRTHTIYNTYQEGNAAAAWGGALLPTNPGSSTWANKSLALITVEDKLQSSHYTAMDNKNGNYYQTVQGLNNTYQGKMAGGEWIDVVRGRDHFVQRIRERWVGLLSSTPKIPYNDNGINMVVALLRAQVAESTGFGYLDPERPAEYVVPLAADIPSATKQTRVLPGIAVTVYLAGAIHMVDPLTVTLVP